MNSIILIRGGGDLGSGVALRLYRSGFQVVILELENPLTVRRTVSFSEAIYSGSTKVEDVIARRVFSIADISHSLSKKEIPILVDENVNLIHDTDFQFPILIDARMLKKPPEENFINLIQMVIGIGPGFTAGVNCHIVIESNRGHFLGYIYRKGTANPDTGQPTGDPTRILRAPISGKIKTQVEIGTLLEYGHVIAFIEDQSIAAPFSGLLRGLIHNDIKVEKGMKIGDMDHRTNKELCYFVSDKAMAIGGSVLEVILSDMNVLPIRIPTLQ